MKKQNRSTIDERCRRAKAQIDSGEYDYPIARGRYSDQYGRGFAGYKQARRNRIPAKLPRHDA
jgi:hypothetical protein